MLKIISNNIKWIFSGVGVAAIVFLVSLIYHPSNYQQPSESRPTPTPAEISKLTPKSIREDLEKLPPLQVPDAAKNYCGIKVKWQCKITSIDKVDNDTVRLMLGWGELNRIADVPYCYIYTNVKLDDYKELAVARKGTKVEVEGIVKHVDKWGSIDLEDGAKLSFL